MEANSEFKRPLRVLLVCDYRKDTASTVTDHVNALINLSKHDVLMLSLLGQWPSQIDLTAFDSVVIHYTLIACSDAYLCPEARRQIAAFKGLKAAFIQDEYRHVDETISAFRELGLHVLFTCVPKGEIDKVYSPTKLPNTIKINVLTGYVSQNLLKIPVQHYESRPIDIGYRGRRVPYWLGEMCLEKARIAERVVADAQEWGLRVDISTQEGARLYGRPWINFLSSCKAVLGVESGASVFDFTGEIQRNVESHQLRDPDVSFEELHRRYFHSEENKINLRQISPRCFEAAALRTLMILYEGDYSGILKPWRHYVPLKKDHSNMDEVVAVLCDPERAQQIIDTAYREIALSPRYTYKAMVRVFDIGLNKAFRPEMQASSRPYTEAFLHISLRAFVLRNRVQRFRRKVIETAYKGAYKVAHVIYTIALRLINVTVPEGHRDAARLALRTAGCRFIAWAKNSVLRGEREKRQALMDRFR